MDKGEIDSRYFISDYEEHVFDTWNDFYKGIDLKIIGFLVWAEEFTGNDDISKLPAWKQLFIQKNRALYERNKKFIDSWLVRNDNISWMVPTHRKMEWQAGKDITNIYEGLIQFRLFGVRVKRPDKFSTLVVMNHPQIVGRYKRRLTP
jgi:DNA (cytosine-5)-methyltransferase 1